MPPAWWLPVRLHRPDRDIWTSCRVENVPKIRCVGVRRGFEDLSDEDLVLAETGCPDRASPLAPVMQVIKSARAS